MTPVSYRTVLVDGIKVFYREAGEQHARTLVLLHGFPSSSHMFRNLLPALAEHFHVVAPDYPGYGYSDSPSVEQFAYTFDHLEEVVEKVLDALKLKCFSIYVQDYGAPVGFRLAVKHPERIEAIISQNGNAYREGLTSFWDAAWPFWSNRTAQTEQLLRGLFTQASTIWLYTQGVREQDISVLMPGRLISRDWIVQAMPTSNWPSSKTIALICSAMHNGRSTSGNINRRSWPCGARMIPSLDPTGQRRLSKICHTARSICWILVTFRSRKMER